MTLGSERDDLPLLSKSDILEATAGIPDEFTRDLMAKLNSIVQKRDGYCITDTAPLVEGEAEITVSAYTVWGEKDSNGTGSH